MYDHEIRWYSLVPVSLLLGLFVLFTETAGLWFKFPARPDWFWILAFFAALRAPPVPAIFAFGWCGLARDLLLGPKPGAASVAFVLVGWLALYWKPLASLRGWSVQALSAGSGAFLVALIKHGLDAGRFAFGMWEKIFLLSLGDALLTGFFYIPVALILCIPSFCPWRERSGYF